MGLESGTYVSDLVETNPPGTDPKSQGDDHLRLIKSVLKNSLPTLDGPLTAAKVPFTPAGGIAAENIQAAIAELDSEKVNRSGDTMTGILHCPPPRLNGSGLGGSNFVFHTGNSGVDIGYLGAGGGAATGQGTENDYAVVGTHALFMVSNNGGITLSAANGLVRTDASILPIGDGNVQLGDVANRWGNIFLVNPPNVGSDARKKTPVRPFTENELSASKVLAKEIGFFKWLEGDQRDHCGLTVQRVVEVMGSHGMDAFSSSMVQYDKDSDNYSLCQGELQNFLLRGMDERIRMLEGAP